jgi:hypothetical protein
VGTSWEVPPVFFGAATGGRTAGRGNLFVVELLFLEWEQPVNPLDNEEPMRKGRRKSCLVEEWPVYEVEFMEGLEYMD